MNPKIGLCLESFAVGERASEPFPARVTWIQVAESGGGAPPPI